MIGQRIKLLREERKLSQAELAAELACNRMTINNYETGKRVPDMEFALAVASFFGVTLEYLAGRTEFRDEDDIKVSVQRAEQLVSVLQRMAQGESQRLLFYLIRALEKALETGLDDATMAVLTACAVQVRRLMLQYEAAEKAAATQVQELMSKGVARAAARAATQDKSAAFFQAVHMTAREIDAAVELFGKEMQKKLEQTLEKPLST